MHFPYNSSLIYIICFSKYCTRCQEAKHFDAMKSLVSLLRVGGFCLSLLWSVGLYRGEEVDSMEALLNIPLSILWSSTAPRSGLGIHVRNDPWKFHKTLRSCHWGGIQQRSVAVRHDGQWTQMMCPSLGCWSCSSDSSQSDRQEPLHQCLLPRLPTIDGKLALSRYATFRTKI